MNICIACGILPPDVGGPASVVPDLATELMDRGHEVTIVTYTRDPEPVSAASIVTVARAGNVLTRYLRFGRAIRERLATTDVLVATDALSVGVPCRLALVGRAERFDLRLGGEWRWESAIASGRAWTTLVAFWRRRESIRDRLERALYAWVLRRARVVMLPTPWLGNILAGAFPDVAGRFLVVRTGGGAPRAEPSEYRQPHKPPRLLYVGRFERVKNVVMLATILRNLADDGARFDCSLVGTGSTIGDCQQETAGVSAIRYLGALSRNDLGDLYAGHDLLLLPSLSDICPNAVIEALAHGLPCLITSEHGLPSPAPGVRECDPMDEAAWKRALEELIDPSALAKLREAASPLPLSGTRSLAEAITDVEL